MNMTSNATVFPSMELFSTAPLQSLHQTTTSSSSSSVDLHLSFTSSIIPPPFDPSLFDYVIPWDDLDSARHQWTDDRAFLPTTITYSLAFIIGVLGNSIVACALLGDARARSPTSSFLASLALADIIFLVVCVPYEIVTKRSSVWAGGNFMCKMAGFVELLSGCTSVLNLTAVSIERYAVIVHPIKARSWCSLGRTHRIILIVWASAIVISSPALYIMKTTQGLFYNSDNYVIVMTCSDNNVAGSGERVAFAWYQMTVLFVLPVCVIIYCYIFVIRVLWQSTKDLDRLTHAERSSHEGDDCRQRLTQSRSRPRSRQGDTNHQDVRQARIQVIKMLLTIIIVFFFCWGPKWVLNILKRHELPFLHTDNAFYIMLIVHLLPYVQSCVNPIVYSFMSNNFRSSFRSQCRRLWRHCRCLFLCRPCRGRDPRGTTPSYRKDGTFDMESLDKWSTVGGGGGGGRGMKHQGTTHGTTCMSVLSEV